MSLQSACWFRAIKRGQKSFRAAGETISGNRARLSVVEPKKAGERIAKDLEQKGYTPRGAAWMSEV